MRIVAALVGVLFLSILFLAGGCDSGETPADQPAAATASAQGQTPQPAEQPEKDPADTGADEQEGDEDWDDEDEEEGDGEEPVPPDEGRIPFDRVWPNDPRARQILPDPNNNDVVFSYWKNAVVGDWLLFMTHQRKLALFTVSKNDGKKVEWKTRYFELDGTETTGSEQAPRSVDLAGDDQVMRGSVIQNPFCVRTVYEWKLYKSDKTLLCERHTVDNPRGENNETCWCWDVRCYGVVFNKRGSNLVILLIRYGDAKTKLNLEEFKASELLRYWYENNRFRDDPFVSQEDPPEGEMPEKPEDPTPEELTKSLKQLEKLVGSRLSKAIKAGMSDKVEEMLTKAGGIVEEARTYAAENNYLPALAESGHVNAKCEELRAASKEDDKQKAKAALDKLRDALDRFYVSVHYVKAKKN